MTTTKKTISFPTTYVCVHVFTGSQLKLALTLNIPFIGSFAMGRAGRVFRKLMHHKYVLIQLGMGIYRNGVDEENAQGRVVATRTAVWSFRDGAKGTTCSCGTKRDGTGSGSA